MTAKEVNGYLRVQYTREIISEMATPDDPESAQTAWVDYQSKYVMDQHKSGRNNARIHEAIALFLTARGAHPERWWRIVYHEETSTPTSSGSVYTRASKERTVAGPDCSRKDKVTHFPSNPDSGYFQLTVPLPTSEMEVPYTPSAGVREQLEEASKEGPGEEVVEEQEGVEQTVEVSLTVDGEKMESEAATMRVAEPLESGATVIAYDEGGNKFEITVV